MPVLFALFLISGATGLVYEVIWLRQLILIFGSTLYATSAILSTFMGGLALGAFLGGRLLDRRDFRPLQLYGALEIGIGLYALAVPGLLSSLTPIYRAAWSAGASESFLILSLVKFAGIAAVLLPPTVLMGASLPVLARQVADDPRRIGGKVGTLYAVNTFGAVAGTFLAGFLAIPWIGVQRTIWTTAAVNVALGLVAILISGRFVTPARAAAAGEAVSAAGPPPLTRRDRIALVAFGISGFSAMVLEVAWTRGLVLVLGSSVYAFSLMLIAFLCGLASGSACFSALLRRRPGIDPGVLLAGLLASAGLLAYATSFLFQWLPRLFAQIHFAWQPSPNGWFAVQLAFGLLVMFPATFAFGGVFPAVLQLYSRGLERVSGSVGVVYASNTLGAIAGAAVAGFLLIPGLGVRDSVVAIAALELMLGLAVVMAVAQVRPRAKTALITPMVLAMALVAAARPGWDALVMNSGVYMNIHDLEEGESWEDFFTGHLETDEVVYVREGLTASVMVADQPTFDNRYLAVNGKVEASTNADMETQLMCAHLPLLLHPEPKDVMIIGLASGITAGAAATHPVERIRIVEVERAVVPAARLFSEHNGNVLDDPRVELSINDARNDLEFSDAAYDVIISEPSNPWMTVASNLFTEEFFRLSRSRLRTGGIFAQWIQNYYLPADDLRSIVAAFRSAFRHVLLFETFEGVDFVVVGSDSPLALVTDRMESRISELRVRMSLARVRVSDSWDILPLFRLGPLEVDRFVNGAARNTDDNARVEFSAPKTMGLDTIDDNLAVIARFEADPLEYLEPRPGSPEETGRVRLALLKAWIRRGRAARARELLAQMPEGPYRGEAEEALSRAKMR